MNTQTEIIQAGDMVIITNPNKNSSIKNALRKCDAVENNQVVINDFGVIRYYPIEWCKKHIAGDTEGNLLNEKQSQESKDRETIKLGLAKAYNYGKEEEIVYVAMQLLSKRRYTTITQCILDAMEECKLT